MDVTPLISSNAKVIQSYSADGFKISGEFFDTPVIVFPDHVVPWDGMDLSKIVDLKNTIDVVLYGTGQTLKMMPARERQALGLHIECMDTGAACRTYNVIMAEGRRVAAALILPKV